MVQLSELNFRPNSPVIYDFRCDKGKQGHRDISHRALTVTALLMQF